MQPEGRMEGGATDRVIRATQVILEATRSESPPCSKDAWAISSSSFFLASDPSLHD